MELMTTPEISRVFARMLSDFCRKRLAPFLPPHEVEKVRFYMLDMLQACERVPRNNKGYDWSEIAQAADIAVENLMSARKTIGHGLDALNREINKIAPAGKTRRGRGRSPTLAVPVQSPSMESRSAMKPRSPGLHVAHAEPAQRDHTERLLSPPRPGGRRRRPVVEFPEPLCPFEDDPDAFHEALAMQMRRHGDTCWSLHAAIVKPGETFDKTTLASWRRGAKAPRDLVSLEILRRIERRYRLPAGYFKAKLPHPGRSPHGHVILHIGPAERRRLAWHLPDDFELRTQSEQEEILDWVRSVVISGTTEYRRFQAAAMKQRYAIRFPELANGRPRRPTINIEDEEEASDDQIDPDLISGTVDAPPRLSEEMATLIRFKTSTLTTFGFQRVGVWGEETASQKIEHLGLMFGALAASPRGVVRGLGVPLSSLTFALLVFPSVWDWYIQWRERRRGFYTAWEIDMLRIALAMTREGTGWLRQSPALAEKLKPIPGLISQEEINAARADWNAACDTFHQHGMNRVREIQRVARVHRDPFEPILAVLEADSPVGEYRKITEEILRLMPNEQRYPRAAAEAVRAFLLMRLGMHLGLRQKNLRQLLVKPRGALPTSERQLVEAKRGELRWSERDQGWEVFIPSVAFKNANSSYFGNKPFRLVLPDLGDLYAHIESYLDRHRKVLLANARDPGTFFVKTVKLTSRNAAYDQNTFYEAWRLVIQRYGIFNPYTGRGAIKGLLPHGPHNVRDVLATHILKKTGSYEQASYAIQDTPDMVAKHYGRFLPQDKAALAAQILNRVWDAA